MSHRNDRLVGAAGALLLAAFATRAQTIGDYSRAQRLMLESAMSQSAARSAGVSASSPVAAAPVKSAPASPAPRLAAAPAVAALPAPAPSVQVSGVFTSGASSLAEVVVNATAYLLQAGQCVPGTPWRVESVAVDRVVLAGHAAAAASDLESVRKVFRLPALR